VNDILHLRKSYTRDALEDGRLPPDPLTLCALWIGEAIEAKLPDANAMALATVDPRGQPAARMVLLRGYDERGFVFFTNYASPKGRDLATTPKAALLFHWASLERQIRLEGSVEQITADESDAYFETRPRGNRLSAWVSSEQSARVPDRAYLETRMHEYDDRFAGREVERPPYWGGYRVYPERYEFWQGRENRVHDRFAYEREAGTWTIVRLAP
jgi:pyridoxamine 5'-phosphate oxidase